MALRVINYQTAELLAYAKQNPGKQLPGIMTLIYHQGEKPWPYSLDIQDLFAEPELAMKYFAKPILIDLPAISDEELKQHSHIGPVEMILKHVRQKNFEQQMRVIFPTLQTVDDKSRKIVLKYLIEVADVPELELLETAKECLPKDKGLIMTVAERLIERGMQQGMQQGMRQGVLETAKKMLLKGFKVGSVQECTGLAAEALVKLKKEILH